MVRGLCLAYCKLFELCLHPHMIAVRRRIDRKNTALCHCCSEVELHVEARRQFDVFTAQAEFSHADRAKRDTQLVLDAEAFSFEVSIQNRVRELFDIEAMLLDIDIVNDAIIDREDLSQ